MNSSVVNKDVRFYIVDDICPSPVKLIWYVDSTNSVVVVIKPIMVNLAAHLK